MLRRRSCSSWTLQSVPHLNLSLSGLIPFSDLSVSLPFFVTEKQLRSFGDLVKESSVCGISVWICCSILMSFEVWGCSGEEMACGKYSCYSLHTL